jgi:aconitate hydratase
MNKEELYSQLLIQDKSYSYLDFFKLNKLFKYDLFDLPNSLKILLENSIRNSDSEVELSQIINSFDYWLKNAHCEQEIMFFPSRVLMQDFTGVPAVVDLAAMRQIVKKNGKDAKLINPLVPVDLVIDHSVQVDEFGSNSSYEDNSKLEFERNQERYKFLKWGQKSFNNFQVVPPGAGICHQVNLEYLAPVIGVIKHDNKDFLIPDTLVGTDSHTTMVCGIGSLGWGVGGIEAEAAMLGKPISMLIPDIVGFELTGKLNEGVTATDLVLTITEQLRKIGVVGKIIEFYGSALENLSLANRATISNMSPEFGATAAYFPIDNETLKYLHLTARDVEKIKLVEKYSKKQNLWRNNSKEAVFTQKVTLDLSKVVASLAGPKRPQDRVSLSDVPNSYHENYNNVDLKKSVLVKNNDFNLHNGDIVIAAITSCTNTSNPAVLIAAGLVAKKALAKGLKPKKFVKTSLAPGSKVVTEYLTKSGLQKNLDEFGFNLVGYGCTTCIGNSGPLNIDIENAIKDNNLTVSSILSGNRNFEGRVHPLTAANYLASPPLVVAYSILGNITKDIYTTSLGVDQSGKEVFLADIWYSDQEVQDIMNKSIDAEMFASKYKTVFKGEEDWQKLTVEDSDTYNWDKNSSYIKNPPFFADLNKGREHYIDNANILALFADSITTDHISPAGNIALNSPAAKYLQSQNIASTEFNSYGSRRGNHEVMMRGTFANIRIKNEMLAGKEGGRTIYVPTKEEMSIYDAAMKYQKEHRSLVVVAGKEYGTGSSRDWAAKGTLLLGVRAVIAESFERIHRSNLVGMGVLPLMFQGQDDRNTLNLTGYETISLYGLDKISAHSEVNAKIIYLDGKEKNITLLSRIDTDYELENFIKGGVLQSVVKNIID